MSYLSGRTSRRTRLRAAGSVAAAALLAGAAAVAIAAPSQAALTTTCIGSAGAVTVPGNLVVPAGEACELSGTIVEGTTTVRGGADLVLLDDAELQGAVTVQADGFIASEESSVSGALNLRSAFGGYLVDSTAGDVVDARSGSYFYSQGSSHAGEVSSRGGELYLEDATVDAAVSSRNDVYADVYNSTLAGDLLVSGVTDGALFCTSEIDGDAVYRSSAGAIQIGAQTPLPDCGFNVFGGNLTINANTGDIQFSDNVVRGDLACKDNTNAPAGEGNRIRGEATGQCAEIAPADAPVTAFKAQRDRAATAEDKLETRLDQAEKAVDEAGPADLG